MTQDGSGNQIAVDNLTETAPEQQPEEVAAPEVVKEPEDIQAEENNAGGVRKKRPSGFIRKITRLEQQLAEATARLAQIEKPAAVNNDAEPQLDDYPTYDTYNSALIDYRVNQTLIAREESRKKEEVKAKEIEKQQVADKTWQEKLDGLDDSYGDYDEVVGRFKGITVPQSIYDVIFEAGPEVAYHLAKDDNISTSIAGMTPLQISKEILKIEQKLSSKPVNKVSKSSEPITPVRGNTRTVAPKLESLDTDSYIVQRYPHLYKK